MPDAARRGFDLDRISQPKTTYDSESELPLHVADQIIVRWKDEYVWRAPDTGYAQRFQNLHAQADCTVADQWTYSNHHLTQV